MGSKLVEQRPIDREFYRQNLAGFLPPRIIDVHTHLWLASFEIGGEHERRGAHWASQVASENTPQQLIADYQVMLPDQHVTPCVFGYPDRSIDTNANNAWVSQVAAANGWPALFLSVPEMPPVELEERVQAGSFAGLKPYLDFAPPHLPGDQVTIYDFLPPAHLEVANAHRWVVMLHIPRPGRLKDPLNLSQMLEIERRFPDLHLIIAHLGRAYCPEDLGNALDLLCHTERMSFDFSANTNAGVMAGLIRAVGSRRILFGSDLPITHMRMRRVCESGVYVNLVPPGIYKDISGDPHMRETGQEEAGRLSFFLYEELLAFKRAAQATNLTSTEIESILYHNARQLFPAGKIG